MATLDLISGGRALVGIGAGHTPVEALVHVVELTDDAEAAAVRLAAKVPNLTPDQVISAPFAWVGTADEIGSDAVDLDDGDSSAGEVAADDRECSEDPVDSLVGTVADATEQQDAGACRAGEREDCAEVRVGRDQHTLFARCAREHVVVGRPLHADRPNVRSVMGGGDNDRIVEQWGGPDIFDLLQQLGASFTAEA